jgi:hypothetical protein
VGTPYPPPAPQSPGRSRFSLPLILSAVVAVLALIAVVVIVVTRGGPDAAPAPKPETTGGPQPTSTTSTTVSQPSTSATALPRSTRPPAPPALPPIQLDQLAGLLLDAGAVAEIVGAPALDMVLDTPGVLGSTTDRPDCGGVYNLASTQGLGGSSWMGAQTRVLRNPGEPLAHHVTEFAIAFPDERSAAMFIANEYQRWDLCRLKGMTVTVDNQTRQWTASVPMLSPSGTQLSASLLAVGSGGWGCQQTAISRRNVVVGAKACEQDGTVAGMRLAAAMLKKVPAE